MRKIIALMMVAVFALSVFADEQGSNKKVEFPLKEPVTLNFIIAGIANMKDPNTLTLFKNLETQTNVKIKWEMVNSGWNEKKALIFANNEVPDAFFGAKAFTNTDIINNYRFFEPLEDYIDEYCPNIKKMFEEMPDLRKYVTAADGHIYSIPQRMPLRPATRNITYINKTWLDKLGMAMPTTIEEYYQALKAFKDKDPNGNGKPDEIPMTFDGLTAANGVGSFYGAFGLSENTSGDWIMVENGKVSFIYADPRIREAIVYINRLYSEGLIDTEAFTQAVGQMNAKVRYPGIAIVGVGNAWTIEAAMNNAARAKEYVALPPLKGPKGYQLWRPSTIMTGDNNAFIMSRKNPNKEITMKWIDGFYNPEVGIQLYFGPIGDCLQLGADGRYTILPSKDPKMTADAWMWANGLNDRSPIYINKTFEQRINWNSWVSEKLSLDKIYAPHAKKVTEFPPFLQYSKAENDELRMIQTEINKFATQKAAQWMVNGGIDKEWEAYLRQLESIGLSRMLQIMQKAYDKYSK